MMMHAKVSNPTETRWRGNGQGNALVARDQRIRKLLDSIEQLRPLNIDEAQEKDRLEYLYPRTKRLKWAWSPAELRRIDMFIARRARSGRPKPFQRDNEVRQLAAEFGRSYMAVHRMIERRRKARKAAKCSDAKAGAEG